jgi:DNA polymerase-3 subunit beta
MFTASRTDLLAALSIVHPVVDKRNTIPVLSNILIRGAGDGLELTGSNLDQEITAPCKAAISAPFGITCPAAALKDFVAKLPDGAELKFEPKEKGVEIRSGRSRVNLMTLPAEDFPLLAKPADAARLTIKGKDLARVIGQVSFAISTEETRYYLNGIHLHGVDAGLAFVATDGHRLALRTLPGNDIPEFPGIIIPTATTRFLQKLAETAGDQEVTIDVTDDKIHARAAGIALTSKLIDGTFPDYRRVIPTKFTSHAETDAKGLAAALERVTILCNKGNAVKFTIGSDAITLSATNAEAGDSSDVIDATSDGAIEIGFNGKYVLQALAVEGDGPIVLRYSEPGSPAILQAPDATDDLSVIMPMRA